VKTIHNVAAYWLKRINPDIVHLNTSSLIAWGRVAYKLGIPVVWHIREPLASGYSGFRRRLVQGHVGRYSSLILPICRNDARPWNQNGKVRVVYNAVDPKIFNVEASSTKKREGKILFLGGLSKEKGTRLIFTVFKELLREMPNVQLLVAGYFDRSLKNGLMSCLPTNIYKHSVLKVLDTIEHRVTFLGPIHNVPEVMSSCDVLVFPATVGHFARPVIEAGFMKKPVVASNLSPLDELILDGSTGFLVSPSDIDGWVDKLKLLITDKKLFLGFDLTSYSFIYY